MNNLALLKCYKQDSLEILSKEYNSFIEHLKNKKINFNMKGEGHAGRLFFSKDELPSYFQNVINTIGELIAVPYDNIVLQFGHAASHVVHTDVYRKTNLTIPLLPVLDPVAFYPEGTKAKGHRYGYADKSPEQISYYSYEHPMLLNVCKLHAVLSSVEVKPRALLQIGWDVATFDKIIEHNPNNWEIIKETGKQRLS